MQRQLIIETAVLMKQTGYNDYDIKYALSKYLSYSRNKQAMVDDIMKNFMRYK